MCYKFSDSGKTRQLGVESEIFSKLAPTGREWISYWLFHFSRCLEGVVVQNIIIGIKV